jgi:hypothetical protein
MCAADASRDARLASYHSTCTCSRCPYVVYDMMLLLLALVVLGC